MSIKTSNTKEAIREELRQLDENQQAKLPSNCDPKSLEWRRIMMDEKYLKKRRAIISQLVSFDK